MDLWNVYKSIEDYEQFNDRFVKFINLYLCFVTGTNRILMRDWNSVIKKWKVTEKLQGEFIEMMKGKKIQGYHRDHIAKFKTATICSTDLFFIGRKKIKIAMQLK